MHGRNRLNDTVALRADLRHDLTTAFGGRAIRFEHLEPRLPLTATAWSSFAESSLDEETHTVEPIASSVLDIQPIATAKASPSEPAPTILQPPAATTPPESIPLEGDADGDGSVELTDLLMNMVGLAAYSPADAIVAASTEPLLEAIVAGERILPGDYVDDDRVDGLDFLKWQRTYGSTTDLAADGDESGTVDGPDLAIWEANYPGMPTLGSFSITGPGDTLSDTSFTVEWTASTNADSYRVTISQFQEGSSPFIETTVNAPDTSRFVDFNLTPGTYYVGVTAQTSNGEELAADNFDFELERVVAPKTMFVTSEELLLDDLGLVPPFLPFISGIEAADWACTFYASEAGFISGWNGLDLIYKAVMSDTGLNASSRIGLATGEIHNTQGQLIASSRDDFFDGTIEAPILMENGLAPPTNLVWTGSNADGTEAVGETAGSWNDFFGVGRVGDASATTGGEYIDDGILGGTSAARCYCISP